MSFPVSNWVFESSKSKSTQRLLLLSIANYCHEDGTQAYPGQERLARMCNISVRQVIRLLASLEASGELIIERAVGPNGVNVYSIPVPWGPHNRGSDKQGKAGDISTTHWVTSLSPNPLKRELTNNKKISTDRFFNPAYETRRRSNPDEKIYLDDYERVHRRPYLASVGGEERL